MTTDQPIQGSRGVAILRITLGFILLATWFGNVRDNKYGADELRGFFTWLYQSPEEGGNGGTLGAYEAFLSNVIDPIAAPYGILQLVLELAIGLGLFFGVATRISALGAMFFFGNLFLAYFGGEEWIGTYILLFVASLTVFLEWGGRMWGFDQKIAATRGESPGQLLW